MGPVAEAVLVLAGALQQVQLQGCATVGDAQVAKTRDPALQPLGKEQAAS